MQEEQGNIQKICGFLLDKASKTSVQKIILPRESHENILISEGKHLGVFQITVGAPNIPTKTG